VIKQYGDLPLVECYAGQLNQVFMNILTNAIDALEEQTEENPKFLPQITIRTEQLDTGQISVQIADNGAGMSKAVQQRLFDPFFTTKPVGKGTGMGLSISYQIITEKHGGSLRCTSTPSQGTVFSVVVPIQQADSPN
jgi:signal transduction histidine kinase